MNRRELIEVIIFDHPKTAERIHEYMRKSELESLLEEAKQAAALKTGAVKTKIELWTPKS
jgi:hypothetical protein